MKERRKKFLEDDKKPHNDILNKFIQNGKEHNKTKHCYSLNKTPSVRYSMAMKVSTRKRKQMSFDPV